MPLIVTPGRLERKADLFHQLGQMTSSGIGLIQALQLQQRSPPSRAWRAPLSRVVHNLESGQTFSEAIRSIPQWISSFDLALLHAAESSGRLPAIFELLAANYRQRAGLGRDFLASIAYPVLILHLAVCIFPISALQGLVLRGEMVTFFIQKCAMLLPLYLLVLGGMFLLRETHAKPWRATIERLLGLVPVLGSALRHLALARLAVALEALLSAGAPIIESWDLAAAASGSPALDRAVRGFKPLLNAGGTPAEALRNCSEFPDQFSQQYASGEISGKLDETLRWLHRHHQEEGTRKLRTALSGLGFLIYFSVVLAIAWQVISFYMGYFNQLQQVMPP